LLIVTIKFANIFATSNIFRKQTLKIILSRSEKQSKKKAAKLRNDTWCVAASNPKDLGMVVLLLDLYHPQAALEAATLPDS
jgi:hypothetical protein